MTTSLALLPPSSAAQSKQRPKLSLNTAQAQIRTFGKGSSLRLDTLSAVSPTIRNTFSNGYEPRPASASEPPSSSSPKPWSADTPTSASTYDSTISTSSASSLGLDSARIPYSLPHNVKSILANSPLPPVVRHRTMKPMFPPAKRVSFRAPLTEEIRTTKYTVAHSDLESSSSTISSLSLDCHPSKSAETKEPEPESEAPQIMNLPSRTVSELALDAEEASKPSKSPSLAMNLSLPGRKCKRESPSDSESDGDECPQTPVAGRRKRRREWVWTLGPINGQKPPADLASPAGSEDSSTESR
ncbi:hypothetical protein IWX90DRAFT_175869 [Phyllosticta citrichinensis]|uniref:Uncharacterized protein n=1 Tax=Phyllosticta citrichinensis TaxID=1130410 RepID=A0ABR1XVQ3_9PEZI